MPEPGYNEYINFLEEYIELIKFFQNPDTRKNLDFFINQDFFFSAKEGHQYLEDVKAKFDVFLEKNELDYFTATEADAMRFYLENGIDSEKIQSAERVKMNQDKAKDFFDLLNGLHKQERFSSMKDVEFYLNDLGNKFYIFSKRARVTNTLNRYMNDFYRIHDVNPQKLEAAKRILKRGYVHKTLEVLLDLAQEGKVDIDIYIRLKAAKRFFDNNWDPQNKTIKTSINQKKEKGTTIHSSFSAVIPTKLQNSWDKKPAFFYDSSQPSCINRNYQNIKHYTITQLGPRLTPSSPDIASRYLIVLNQVGTWTNKTLIYQNIGVNQLADTYQDTNFIIYGACKVVRDVDNLVTSVAVPATEVITYTTAIPSQLDQRAYKNWQHFLHGGGADKLLGEDSGNFIHSLACLDWSNMTDAWIRIQGHAPQFLKRQFGTPHLQFIKGPSQSPLTPEKQQEHQQMIALGEQGFLKTQGIDFLFLDLYVNTQVFENETPIAEQLNENQEKMVELGILSPLPTTFDVGARQQLMLNSWHKLEQSLAMTNK